MNDLNAKVDAFFLRLFPGSMKHGPEEYFADTGALSSLEVVQLAVELESVFGVRVEDSDINEETLGSRSNVKRFLEARL